MPNIIEGKLLGEGKKFALITSRFNDFITDKLLAAPLTHWFVPGLTMMTSTC